MAAAAVAEVPKKFLKNDIVKPRSQDKVLVIKYWRIDTLKTGCFGIVIYT